MEFCEISGNFVEFFQLQQVNYSMKCWNYISTILFTRWIPKKDVYLSDFISRFYSAFREIS